MPLASFRRRTVEGLLLLIPESADLLIPWEVVVEARIDLLRGRVQIEFREDYARRQPWLRGATQLSGNWLDRYEAHAGED